VESRARKDDEGRAGSGRNEWHEKDNAAGIVAGNSSFPPPSKPWLPGSPISPLQHANVWLLELSLMQVLTNKYQTESLFVALEVPAERKRGRAFK